VDEVVFVIVHLANSIPTVPTKGIGHHWEMLRGLVTAEIAVIVNNISMKSLKRTEIN
jgi:hypothetical protein